MSRNNGRNYKTGMTLERGNYKTGMTLERGNYKKNLERMNAELSYNEDEGQNTLCWERLREILTDKDEYVERLRELKNELGEIQVKYEDVLRGLFLWEDHNISNDYAVSLGNLVISKKEAIDIIKADILNLENSEKTMRALINSTMAKPPRNPKMWKTADIAINSIYDYTPDSREILFVRILDMLEEGRLLNVPGNGRCLIFALIILYTMHSPEDIELTPEELNALKRIDIDNHSRNSSIRIFNEIFGIPKGDEDGSIDYGQFLRLDKNKRIFSWEDFIPTILNYWTTPEQRLLNHNGCHFKVLFTLENFNEVTNTNFEVLESIVNFIEKYFRFHKTNSPRDYEICGKY